MAGMSVFTPPPHILGFLGLAVGCRFDLGLGGSLRIFKLRAKSCHIPACIFSNCPSSWAPGVLFVSVCLDRVSLSLHSLAQCSQQPEEKSAIIHPIFQMKKLSYSVVIIVNNIELHI